MHIESAQAISANQLWLPGLEAAPRPTDQLYFAVFPERGPAAAMATLGRRLCSESQSRARATLAGRIHVNLLPVGQFCSGLPDGLVEAVRVAINRLEQPEFTVTFDAVSSPAPWPQAGPLMLAGTEGAVGFQRLREALSGALAQADLDAALAMAGHTGEVADPGEHPWYPQVALSPHAPWKKPGACDPIAWRVDEVVLVHGVIGKSQHSIVGRWRLGYSSRDLTAEALEAQAGCAAAREAAAAATCAAAEHAATGEQSEQPEREQQACELDLV